MGIPELKYKCILVDDDVQNIEMLQHILAEFYNSVFEITGTFHNAVQALKYINTNPVDIIFLDIEMPELSGFELIQSITGQSEAKIIIISSHDQYALKSFRYSVFDFLKKPVGIADIGECVKKLQKEYKTAGSRTEVGIKDNILVVNRQDKTIFLEIGRILRIEAAGSYTDIYMDDGSRINTTKKIGYYEQVLLRLPFYKLHRSHLVNLNKIKEIVKNNGEGMVVMQDGSRIEISKVKKDEFLRLIIKDNQNL